MQQMRQQKGRTGWTATSSEEAAIQTANVKAAVLVSHSVEQVVLDGCI
jgi:hypothetical protein